MHQSCIQIIRFYTIVISQMRISATKDWHVMFNM